MRKFILIFCIIFSISGCFNLKKIGGVYMFKSNYKEGKKVLHLLEDGIYLYFDTVGLIQHSSRGKWTILDSKKLVLELDDSLKPGLKLLSSHNDNNNDSIFLNFNTNTNEPVGYGVLLINDDFSNPVILDENGKAKIAFTFIKKLHLLYLGNSYLFSISNSNAKVYSFQLRTIDLSINSSNIDTFDIGIGKLKFFINGRQLDFVKLKKNNPN